MMKKKRELQVIINADDLGMDIGTNNLVFELMEKELITSATIMANFPAYEDAITRHTNYPNCSFGVHLNLTSGEPLSKNESLEPILTSDGVFAGLDSLIRAKKSISLLKAIYEELSLQVKKVLVAGVQVTHLDSHQHVHNIPSILLVTKLLQKKYNIRKIRLSKNIYELGDRNNFQYLKKRVFNSFLLTCFKSYSTHNFTGFDTLYQVGSSTTIKGDSVEVMVHLRLGEKGWSDYQMLQGNWQDELVFPVRLISYDTIGQESTS